MTPQEKSRDLFDKMYIAIHIYQDDSGIENDCAKQCALIAVDEIIKSNPYSPSEFHPLPHFKAGQYWKEVKQEIEKL